MSSEPPSHGRRVEPLRPAWASWMPAAAPLAFRNSAIRARARADRDHGLAWLSFESSDNTENPYLDLTLWPGGQKQRLARAHPHGRWVKWKGSQADV